MELGLGLVRGEPAGSGQQKSCQISVDSVENVSGRLSEAGFVWWAGGSPWDSLHIKRQMRGRVESAPRANAIGGL